ncbi:UNVERIFIED_CONTAM: hypothetical protein Slati_3874000, partial [Sesamum latifolium]
IVCAESWGQDVFLVEKLKDLKTRLENDTYIDVILQSLPPSYDPFIVNYNMNGLEKSIHELINMLVQYEATTHKGKGKGKLGGSQRLKANDVCMHCKERGIGRGSVHNSSPTQVLERSKKLSKDEMVLRLGDRKAVAAEAVGPLSLVVSNRIWIDLKLFLCQIWHARLGHISKDGIRRFKEYRLEVENQTNRKIKVLQSDRGGEYLSGEFIDYLKENGILSQWAPPGTPQLNRVAERRNRTLLDMVRSMMSFTELPPSFWGYALETATKLLNIASSKSVLQTPYEIWHGKPASYKYLRVLGSPAYVKRLVGDKLDLRFSLCRFIEYPKETAGYYFYDAAEQKTFVSRNAVFLEKGFPPDNGRDEVLIEESNEEPQHHTRYYLSLRFTLIVFQSSVGQLENLEYLRGMDSWG